MIKVNSRYQKVSPKKAILVARLISGMRLVEARDQLINLEKKSSKGYLDLVKQVQAIAKSKGIDEERLFITTAICQQAPQLKRRIFAGRGHANQILKRMSHFTITVEEKEIDQAVDKKAKKSAKKTATSEKVEKIEKDKNGTKS